LVRRTSPEKEDDDDSLGIGKPVEMFVDRLFWNERVMALRILKTDPEVPSINPKRHITVALLEEDAKPTECNALLEGEASGQLTGVSSIDASSLNHIPGVIEAFFK